jgi:HSP20 family molecular chaperone IbpA
MITTMYNKLIYKYQITENGLVFNIELAGKSKEDVKIFKEDSSIVIKVEDNRYEISYGDYIFRAKYDFDNVKAKMKNGLLTITVPQIKKIQKNIEIE